jgi:two-component system sensor histidine kinase ChvG
LSGALRDMTRALFARLEAIERFAADVAHELKNPLTSLRSAVETLPIAKTDASRGRLLEVIEHDVRRLDRLITDISDASRLDAELARGDMDLVDIARLLRALVDVGNQVEREDRVKVALTIEGDAQDANWLVFGHDSRLGQVVNNLIDNARSFSEPGGQVRVSLRRARGEAQDGQAARDGFEITVDDDGPGIPAHAFERIFERFYTDRPNQSFGQNSGLGLSISRQIVEAHGGSIHAINRVDAQDESLGARFVVFLPAASE